MATWGGLGRLPRAPGTFGTLGAIPFVAFLAILGPYAYLLSSLFFIFIAILICQAYEDLSGQHDCSEVVIDEVAGYLLAMTWLPVTWQSVLASFVLFRLLDAVKPYPINKLDHEVGGGFGVVADDLVAGLLTNIVLQAIYINTPWLGQQLI